MSSIAYNLLEKQQTMEVMMIIQEKLLWDPLPSFTMVLKYTHKTLLDYHFLVLALFILYLVSLEGGGHMGEWISRIN